MEGGGMCVQCSMCETLCRLWEIDFQPANVSLCRSFIWVGCVSTFTGAMPTRFKATSSWH